METAEIEVLIEELEQRVERLRALYDQYFMGIEKIEPAVLRKDVDRRVWMLRREQIRNTGMRFKFNTVVQRYNTYQQYWMRICREIENGTYKRDLRRAAKKFGTEALTIQARKRLGKQLQRELEEEAAESRAREPSDSMDIDVELDMGEEQPAAPAPAPLPRKKAPVHVLSLDALDNLEDVLGLATSPERPQPPSSRGARQSFGNIDDVFGGADERDETRPHERAALSVVASGTRPQPPATALRSPAPPLPPRRPVGATPPGPPSRPSAQPASAPASTGLGLPRKAPLPPTGAATSPPHAPSPPQPAMSARPAPPRPVAPTPPGSQARAAASAPPKPGGGADPALSETRMREIYARYVQAKRECRESTSGITEDGLSRSLRATVEKLKSQHKGRQIDFDVVIKDGKAVLKPVVKG